MAWSTIYRQTCKRFSSDLFIHAFKKGPMGVIHRSFLVAQEKFEYITSAVHDHAAKERVSLFNMLDVRSRNAGLIREKSLHFHVQFIFIPKEDNCIHHICGMMQINGLLIFPLVDQQDRLGIILREKVFVLKIASFFSNRLCRPGSFHLFCKFACIAIHSGVVKMN